MTLSKRIARAIAPALALLPAPLAAQDAEAEAGDIVVTGSNQQVSVATVQRQARDIAVPTGNVLDAPLARFEDRLCPGTAGLTEPSANAFNARVRANAEALGLRLAGEPCDPNFVTVFTRDGAAMLEQLIDANPQNFAYLDSGDLTEMLAPGPVHVWSNAEPRTLTGMPIAQVRDLTNPPRMGVWQAHTRIYTTTRSDITSVMVLFDVAAVQQMTVVQLADYATMRGLAQTRVPAGEPALDSILTLFQSDAPPRGLTMFDRAYLHALYDGQPNLPAFRKLADTADQLERLTRPAGDARIGGE